MTIAKKYYIKHTQLERLESMGFESNELPQQNEVVDWLREVKHLHITPIYTCTDSPWSYHIQKLGYSEIRRYHRDRPNYYDCISEAIDTCLNIIENGWYNEFK